MKKKAALSYQKLFWQLATLLGLIILLVVPINLSLPSFNPLQSARMLSTIAPVEASEIYPMFTCPCCGQTLNKEEPCCGAMIQMIDFIDQKITTGATKNNIILATAQEFGLERLTNESDRVSLRQQLTANSPTNAPKIVVDLNTKDLGQVSRTEGIVTTEFTIRNQGKSDLIINKLSSSCGCTSASLIYQSLEGPRFYMPGHGKQEPEPNWQAIIPASDEAIIKVYYDPTVHPDLTGPVTRTVSILSNDPVDFEIKLTITLEQI